MIARRLTPPLVAALVAACNCGTTEVQDAVPSATLSAARACDPRPADAHEVCLELGPVAVGAHETAELVVSAGTSARVALSALTLAGPDAAAFALPEPAPTEVPGNGNLPISLVFSPTWVAADAAHPWTSPTETFRAEVTFATDDPEHPTLAATVLGRAGIAALRAEPTAIEFGAVPVGSRSLPRRVRLTNEGPVPMDADAPPSFDAAATAAGFRAASSLNVTHLAPGESVSFDLELAPVALGPVSGALVFATNDPRGPLSVALSGTGVANTPPVACLGVARVYDRFRREKAREPDGTYALEPFDRVILTSKPAADGAAMATCPDDSGDPEGDPVFVTWGAPELPEGSRGALSATSVHPLSAWQRELFVDTRGEFVVRLTVKENNGIGLENEAAAHLHVAPLGFSVALDWTEAAGATAKVDLDLHLVRPAWPGETFTSPRVCTGAAGPDCYWSNCKLATAGVPPVDWGASGPDDATAGSPQLRNDPTLNRDSTGGAPLVENTSIGQPAAGDYEVYVHFFEDGRAGRPGNVPFELQVTFGDTPPQVVRGVMSSERALVHAATLRWTGTAAGSTLVTPAEPATTLSVCAE